jgi:hypothetical protein
VKKNLTHDDSYTDLKELDRLVTQELDVLQQQSRKTTRVKKTQKQKPRHADNVIFKEGWQKDKPNYKSPLPPQQSPFPDNIENLQDEQEDVLKPVDDQQSGQTSQTELFTEEELDFIERSTAWLESRENKDLIISRIWEQLTESVPESFYSVKSEGHPETEDSYTEAQHNEDNPETDSPESSG